VKSTGVLVVGGGIAGQAVCEAIRRRDREIALTIVCEEARAPFDRVGLSTLLAEDADAEELRLRPDEWYQDQRVDLRTGAPVESLDPRTRTASLGGREEIRFEHAVLATGSEPLMPPIPGIELPGVHAFRSPEDCDALRAAADATAAANGSGRPAAVIGGGLLGLEAARGIAARGCRVTVVHLMDRLMERQLDAGAAALLGAAMEDLGVEVLLERETERILGEARATGLRFTDGDELECAFVCVSIGIRARLELARAARLDCDRGIVVDDRMRTSAPGVLAVGECAEHAGTVYGIVSPIHDQAAVAADSILGADGAPYAGSIPSTKLKVMGVDLVSIGDATGAYADESAAVASNRERGVYRRLVTRGGRVAGATLLGDTRGHELLLDAVRTGREAPDPLELLADASEASAGDLPDGAQICNCNGVCKGEIVAAIHDLGLGSTAEVVAATRAGSGCGSCKPTVAELLRIERGGAEEEPTYLCPCRRQTREQLAAAIRDQGLASVSEVGSACGTGHDCGACKPGLAYLVSEIAGNRHREERHARFINDRVHANIQRDGTFSVVPRIRGGVTSPAELRRIADVAERFEVPMVKITGGQRIDLLGVRKEQLPAIWEALDMPSGHAYAKAVRTVKTCVGTDFCRFGLGDAIDAGVELEREMEGLYTPHKVKSSVSGCPRNCAESYVKDIGVVAVEGGWEVYVGGAAGSTVRKGDLLASVETKAQALRVAITFLQHYRENADYLERTYAFVERVGIESVKRAVLDEQGGEPARLRERFRIAKAAVLADPWLERRDPVHTKQFAELDSEAEPIGPPIGAER
jgi:nitrite reductase (NADH) large subunit